MLCFASLTFSGLVAASTKEDHINRYERSAYDLMLEQIWSHEIRQNYSLDKQEQMFSTKARTDASAAIKAEWYLRRGKFGAPLVLADLFQLTDLKLADEVLWGLLKEASGQQLFSESVSWDEIQRVMRAFLNSYPQGKALANTSHGDWWSWLRSGALPENAGPDLSAIHHLIRARQKSGVNSRKSFLEKSKGYLRSMLFLQKPQFDSERRTVALEWSRDFINSNSTWGSDTETVGALQAVVESLGESNASGGAAGVAYFLRNVGDAFAQLEQRQLAAASRSLGLEFWRRSGQKLDLLQALHVADLHYETEQWEKARSYYSTVLSRMLDETHEYFLTTEAQRAELRFLISRHKSQKDKDLAIEAQQRQRGEYEVVLSKVFHSSYRDEALVAFAEFLEKYSSAEEARQAWTWAFQFGNLRTTRTYSANRVVALLDESFSKSHEGADYLRQSLGLMQSIAKANMAKAPLRRALSSLERAAEKEGLQSKADFRASINSLKSMLRTRRQ